MASKIRRVHTPPNPPPRPGAGDRNRPRSARRARVLRGAVATVCAAVVVLAAGCGGSTGDGTTEDATTRSTPGVTDGTTTETEAPPPATPDELAARGYAAVWRADFDDDDGDGADFSHPDGSENGECRREVSDDAARYVWVASDEDGASTRCYPNHLFSRQIDDDRVGEVDGPWIFSGRFLVELPDARAQLDRGFLSLITFQVAPPQDESDGSENAWTSVVTINVAWEEGWETPRLNIFHVPEHDEGDYRRETDSGFPLGRWVDVRVEWDEENRVEVYQDGELVITAEKTTGEDGDGEPLDIERAELHGMHFGGYASASVQGWEIGNDELVVAVPDDEAARRQDEGL